MEFRALGIKIWGQEYLRFRTLGFGSAKKRIWGLPLNLWIYSSKRRGEVGICLEDFSFGVTKANKADNNNRKRNSNGKNNFDNNSNNHSKYSNEFDFQPEIPLPPTLRP